MPSSYWKLIGKDEILLVVTSGFNTNDKPPGIEIANLLLEIISKL
jgi:hypothetical protein